ncbi:MAG: serine/threonine-protein phosphatase [Ardenticatenaceae bacterium]|nr:serine/threonine-protein phosphatase [Anaerolineales bacterium]MCB8982828.1 serine/threonine-protein phosphatase [Ardenticatenaceae bacterium]
MDKSTTLDDPEEERADENSELVPDKENQTSAESRAESEEENTPQETTPLAKNPFVDVPRGEPAKTRPIISKVTEPLLAEEPHMRVAKRCHVGARRERNEDSSLTLVSEVGGHFAVLPFGLYIVADGMGGHSDGHVASRIASRTAAMHIIHNIYLPLLEDSDKGFKAPIQEVLEQAVQKANKAVFENDPEMDSGTTLTIALVLGRRLHVAHVGDSRLYLMANGKFEPITNDHSLVQRLQDVGQLTAEEATFYRYGHILLRAVGQADEVEVDTYMRLLPKSGKLLMCSDGLSGFVSEAEMRSILERDIPLEEMADALFRAAMDMGGFDNITAVLVDFEL